jgi:hypothetical protein
MLVGVGKVADREHRADGERNCGEGEDDELRAPARGPAQATGKLLEPDRQACAARVCRF